MPTFYIYSPDDFVGDLPDEQGAAAEGTGPFTLTLKDGAEPTVLNVSDDDDTFDEVDRSQAVGSDTKFDGIEISAGTSVHAAYDLIDSSSGAKVTSFHFGGSGHQQGAVDGVASTEPLSPGQSYTFDVERSSYRQGNEYKEYVACFTPGCRVALASGEEASVESLQPGDFVVTQDNGPQAIRAVLRTEVPAIGALAPVRLPPGTVGNRRSLLVSPQHRFLLHGLRLQCFTGLREALVPALRFVEVGAAERVPGGRIAYLHLVFDRHEVIFAEGARTESFHPAAIESMPSALRRELDTLYSDQDTSAGALCRPILKRWEAHAVLG